ncbi:uncharacterized protein LOC117904525 isoform X4 [Vitis riparia]|uniref:uncharacterized protein LOC117904525 isoform X4 n=1 Tax=Vitis riparia TaxID=96939 RepID=UPI00155AE308|nr:uncharacterized protein LOC117904525 isoform X4 [Vitis riparia]
METLDATSSCSSSASNLQSPSSKTPQPPPSVIRLSRPAAQRNLRNQWSKLASYRQQWTSTASKGRSHATDLVNSYLSQRYMPAMELGVLSDMPNIRKKACMKLKQQGLHGSKLLSAYKDMVGTSNHDVLACQSSQTHRLLIVELLSISCEEAPQDDRYCWSDELYPGEFDDLGICSLHSKEIGDIIPPKIIGFESHSPVTRSNQQPDHEILQG